VADNGHQQILYSVPHDGTLPLQFEASESGCQATYGPYSFTVYVSHQLIPTLTAVAHPGRHSTTFTVSLRDPDGATISPNGLHATLQLREKGKWVTIKTNAPLHYGRTWPKAQRKEFQSVRVSVSAPSYRSASASTRVKAV
jgi:hypothetical protein